MSPWKKQKLEEWVPAATCNPEAAVVAPAHLTQGKSPPLLGLHEGAVSGGQRFWGPIQDLSNKNTITEKHTWMIPWAANHSNAILLDPSIWSDPNFSFYKCSPLSCLVDFIGLRLKQPCIRLHCKVYCPFILSLTENSRCPHTLCYLWCSNSMLSQRQGCHSCCLLVQRREIRCLRGSQQLSPPSPIGIQVIYHGWVMILIIVINEMVEWGEKKPWLILPWRRLLLSHGTTVIHSNYRPWMLPSVLTLKPAMCYSSKTVISVT